MNQLRLIQRDIQAALLSNQTVAQVHINGPDTDFIQERLAIYSDGYQLRLCEILAGDFPGVKALLGDKLFEEVCIEYITVNPSQHANARYFGTQFAHFLKNHRVYYQQPELADMAVFEWALGLTEDAADITPLMQADLIAIPENKWPELLFYLHPSVQFIELTTNVPYIWQAIQNKDSLPTLQLTKPDVWTLWRYDLTAHYHSHSEQELSFLNAIKGNKNFAEICDLLADDMAPEDAAQLAINFIITFLNNQMFVKKSK